MKTAKYQIEEKKDFGNTGHFIDGEYVKTGFVVTNGAFVNVVPGATWFRTKQDAQNWIDKH